MFNAPGRASFVIDGQFGSTGKGLICGYLGLQSPPDVSVSCASANAGHTFIGADGTRIIANHLPIAGILCKNSTIYLGAGAILDPQVLNDEIEKYLDNVDRLLIHPRACIIESVDVQRGRDPGSQSTKVAGTQHGVSQALSRKVLREATLAEDHPGLKKYVRKYDLNLAMESGASVMVEVAQGYGLGLNSGYMYPYTTSREVSLGQSLSDCQIHPRYLGNVMMTVRTYPIRVGNIYGEGQQKGWSGPFYPDSEEKSWEALGLTPERTTVTKRVRRVATFSPIQYHEACAAIKPDYVFLNFVNYCTPQILDQIMNDTGFFRPVTHYGFGPTSDDVTTDQGVAYAHTRRA